jgi:hypothetical protein
MPPADFSERLFHLHVKTIAVSSERQLPSVVMIKDFYRLLTRLLSHQKGLVPIYPKGHT